MDNAFIDRLWRTLKYEEIYLQAHEMGIEAGLGIQKWMNFYNQTWPHSSLGGELPVFISGAPKRCLLAPSQKDNALLDCLAVLQREIAVRA